MHMCMWHVACACAWAWALRTGARGGGACTCACGMWHVHVHGHGLSAQVLEEEGLRARATDTGDWLRAAVLALRDDEGAHGACIGDVRGLGLFIGVEFVTDRAARTPAEAETNVLCSRLKVRARARVSCTHAHPSAAEPFTPSIHTLRSHPPFTPSAHTRRSHPPPFRGATPLQDVHRILTSIDGPHDNVLVIKPPMCFGRAEATQLVAALRQELEALKGADLSAVSHTPT